MKPVPEEYRVLDVREIALYDHNPRHSANPKFDVIKASIRAQGMDQPLVVTQRPGETAYMIGAGGNTRLTILKALYEETGDARFSRVPCVVRPWCGESEVLLAHLRENDLRGGLTFIEKARAVLEAKPLIEAEMGTGELTHKDFVKVLQSSGYSISRSVISQMAYAVQTLLPLIPQALEAGLGKHQVERIRALERAARRLWQRYDAGDDSGFDAVLMALCRRYDGPDWDTDSLQRALETEIAEATETSIHTLRVALDAELDGRKLVIPEVESEPVTERSWTGVSPTGVDDSGDGDDDTAQAERDRVAISVGSERSDTQPAAPAEVLNEGLAQPTEPAADASARSTETLLDVDASAPRDLKSLRGRAWTLAARLAQRHGIGELVMPLSGQGLGFVLRDVPDPELTDQLDDDTLNQVSMLWWQLAACAEMTFAPLEAIVPTLPSESVLRKALEDQDAGLLFNSVWTLDPGHTGYRLWRALNDADWRDLIHLMDTYRRIRQLAADTGTALWG
jgi:ParB family protein of integrating conjugative element (PFGI_1 class)